MFKFLLSLLLVSGTGYAESDGGLSIGAVVNQYSGFSMKYKFGDSHLQAQFSGKEKEFHYSSLDFVHNHGALYFGVGVSYYSDLEERYTYKWDWEERTLIKVLEDPKDIQIIRIPIGLNKLIDDVEVFGEIAGNVHMLKGDKPRPFDTSLGIRLKI